MDNFIFYGLVLPISVAAWIGLIGFALWLITEPLAWAAEKIANAFRRGFKHD